MRLPGTDSAPIERCVTESPLKTGTMGASKQLSNDLRTNIIQQYRSGEGYKKLSQRFQLSVSTVRNIVRKWKTTGTVLAKARSGRPRKITEKQRLRMVTMVQENPKTTSVDIQRDLAADGVTVHRSTIQHTLQKEKLSRGPRTRHRQTCLGPDHLNGDVKQVRATERTHKCQICNASFATRDRLRSHLACRKDKIRCGVCCKFLRAAHMMEHLKTHGGGTTHDNGGGQEDAGTCSQLESKDADSSSGDLPRSEELKSPQEPDRPELDMPSSSCNGAPAEAAPGSPSAEAAPGSPSAEAASPEGSKANTDAVKKLICGICGQAFCTVSHLDEHKVPKARRPQVSPGWGVNERTPPPHQQQNMSLLEFFGLQIVQSAFASPPVDAELGQSGLDLEGK